jgi:hypothetical protein
LKFFPHKRKNLHRKFHELLVKVLRKILLSGLVTTENIFTRTGWIALNNPAY